MIRIFFLLVLFVTMISLVLHVSAGWAWIIGLAILASVVIYKVKSGTATAQYVKPSAMWKCPYCLKRAKLGATVCHHCGRSLVRSTEAN